MSSSNEPRFFDSDGKLSPSFEEEIKKKGFEEFVIELLEACSWVSYTGGADGDDGDYEGYMLNQASKYFKKNPGNINLAKIVQGKYNFSGTFRAPAFHWFLQWGMDISVEKLIKHGSVNESVLNALDNKGNSALYYCHAEQYQAGWSPCLFEMSELISDPRFVALDFPVIPEYGGGVMTLDLPARKVVALVQRNLNISGATTQGQALRKTVNSTREGCSLLHMLCDEFLVKDTAPATLITLVRGHPEFARINHTAKGCGRGGFGNTGSHQIQEESCLSAVLRKRHTQAREQVVKALLKPHPSGDQNRDVHIRDKSALAEVARENGYPNSILSLIAKRAEEECGAGSAQRQPSAGRLPMRATTTSSTAKSKSTKKLSTKAGKATKDKVKQVLKSMKKPKSSMKSVPRAMKLARGMKSAMKKK